ncbi:hypothetical protein L208DRAFT_1392260 [Tricholoma matsutake]|nr:hypothetical protein L208DRAFT_1392260 [Tricholoma matsutake 945]
MDIDLAADPHYILTRVKSCPCCRAVVRRRPVPVFLVKAVVGAVATARGGNSNVRPGGSSSGAGSLDEEDPWKGIFVSDEDEDDYGSSDDYDDDDDDDDEDEENEDSDNSDVNDIMWALNVEMGHMPGPFRLESEESSSGSDSEDEDEDGGEENSPNNAGDSEHPGEIAATYVPARWEPQTVAINADDVEYDPDDFHNVDGESLLKMLRRGCTLAMIQKFEMSYAHRRGLVAHVPSLDERYVPANNRGDDIRQGGANRLFLGWNIRTDEADLDGQIFMRGVLREVKRHPTGQWRVSERTGLPGAFDVKRLVRAEDVEEWDTTDTEAWIGEEGADTSGDEDGN